MNTTIKTIAALAALAAQAAARAALNAALDTARATLSAAMDAALDEVARCTLDAGQFAALVAALDTARATLNAAMDAARREALNAAMDAARREALDAARVARDARPRVPGRVMKAYHFVGKTLRDGRPVPPDGEWLVHEAPVEFCKSGLHFCAHPYDALMHANGNVLCEVEVDDVVETHTDKGVCRRRKIIRRIDATDMLRRFTREIALSVIHLWDAPDVVRQYLDTADESLRAAAFQAAGTAALDSPRSAARHAALSALYAAGERVAVQRAARAAVRHAALAALAAQAAARTLFAAMVEAEFAKSDNQTL